MSHSSTSIQAIEAVDALRHSSTKAIAPQSAAHAARGERVLFITRKWGPAVGGMETYCERLTEELARLRPVDVIALRGRENGQPPGALSLLLFPFTVLRRLFALRHTPAIIHGGDLAIWPLVLMALTFFPKARIVLSAHGTDVSYGARGGLKGRLYSAYLKLGSRLLSRAGIIANSRATFDRLSAIGWSPKAVVPLATDLTARPRVSYDRSQMVFAGRLVERKGCSWFIREVIPLLPKDIHLTVIGTHWDEVEKASLDHPQVDFLGPKPQHELVGYFGKALCVVIPNIEVGNGEYEGFGLIAPEAAAAGGVVLAAQCGGLTDAVRDGETGFLLEPGNAQEWADTILHIREWPHRDRTSFIAQSQKAATRHFSWHRVAEETARAYEP